MSTELLDQKVEELLRQQKINSVDDFVQIINQDLGAEFSRDEVQDVIVSQMNEPRFFHVVLSENLQTLWYRDQIFANTVFKIRLTADEIRDKCLYLGHRLIPFVSPETKVAEMTFLTPSEKEIPKKERALSFIDGMQYISLIAPYQSRDYFQVVGDDQLTLACLDLTDWMKEVDYQQEDLIEVIPIDIGQKQWRFEKLSLKDFNRARIKTNHKDVQLLDGIYDFLDHYMMAFPVDHMLFRVFADGPDHLRTEQGSPLGPLVTSQEDLILFNGDYPYIHYQDFHQQVIADKMEELEEQGLPEPGTSKHLDGIFMEMQVIRSEQYVRVLLLMAQLQERQLSEEELLLRLLGQIDVFDNEMQYENFNQAILNIKQEFAATWNQKQLELPKVNLLRKYLEVKEKVFKAFDEMSELGYPMDDSHVEQVFFLSGLSEQLDQMATWLMDSFRDGDLEMEEIRKLNGQFESMLKQFNRYEDTMFGDSMDD